MYFHPSSFLSDIIHINEGNLKKIFFLYESDIFGKKSGVVYVCGYTNDSNSTEQI